MEKEKEIKLDSAIMRLYEIERFCQVEAQKNPVNNDLFQSGKQQAYSHIYFELMPAYLDLISIVKRENQLSSDKLGLKMLIGVVSFCIGAICILFMFRDQIGF